MIRLSLFVPRRFLLVVNVVLLLVAITTSSVRATASTTITKTVASPLPETRKQNTQYVASGFSNCSSSSEEIETVVIPEKSRTPLLKAVYQWYLKSCIEKPFLAKGVTSGTIAALGDVIAQNIEASTTTKAFSPTRVATFFFCNLLFTGPFIHLWYTFLNIVGHRMEKRFEGVSNLKITVTQVFLDQTLGTIVFFPLYIYVYDMFESVIRLHRLPSWSRATEKCQKHLWEILLTQYRVYPFSNMINFGLIPFELRVLFTSTVSLFWNIYLCSVVGS